MIASNQFSRCPEGSLVIDAAVFAPAFRSFAKQDTIESFASEIALIIEDFSDGRGDWWDAYIESVRIIDLFNANMVPNPIIGDAMTPILRGIVEDVQRNPDLVPDYIDA